MKRYLFFCFFLLSMAIFNQNALAGGIGYEGLRKLKTGTLPKNYVKNQRNNYTGGCSPIHRCRGTYY